jgi:cell division protein FtsB
MNQIKNRVTDMLKNNRQVAIFAGIFVGSFLLLSCILLTVGLIAFNSGKGERQAQEFDQKIKELTKTVAQKDAENSKLGAQLKELTAELDNLTREIRLDTNKVVKTCAKTGGGTAEVTEALASFKTPDAYNCIAFERNLRVLSNKLANPVTRVYLTKQSAPKERIVIYLGERVTPTYDKYEVKSKQSVKTVDGFEILVVTNYAPNAKKYFIETQFVQPTTSPSFIVYADFVEESEVSKVEKDIIKIVTSLDFNKG